MTQVPALYHIPEGKHPSVVPREQPPELSQHRGRHRRVEVHSASRLLMMTVPEERPLMGMRLSPLKRFNNMAVSDLID